MTTLVRLVTRAALVAAAIAAAAPIALASALPPDAAVRAGATVDAGAFARQVGSRYHVVFRRIVVADIDRDGDADVITAGDRGLTVWLNDGQGQLRAASPQQHDGLDGRPPCQALRDAGRIADETIPNESPSSAPLRDRATAPLLPRHACACADADAIRHGADPASAAPRAPPAAR